MATSKLLKITYGFLLILFSAAAILPAAAQTPEQFRYAQIRKLIKSNLHLSAHMVKAVDKRTIEAVRKKVTDADIPNLVKMLNDKEHVVMIGAQHVLATFGEKAIIPLTKIIENEPSYRMSPAKETLNEIHENLSRATATEAGEGIIHGDKDAFKIRAPSGWMLYQIKLPIERSVLYPKETDWNNAYVKIYAEHNRGTAKKPDELANDMLHKLRQEISLNLKISRETSIELNKDKQAKVYYYTDEKLERYIAIAFIESPAHAIHWIMLDARFSGKKAFEESLPVFESAVKSYQWVQP